MILELASEELLEIIDENENVLGVAPRKDFHDPKRKEKLLHRSVHVYVIDSKSNKLWIQKRSMDLELYAGFWDTCVAGHVDPGEAPEQTALRELREEYSINAKRLSPAGTYVMHDEWQRQLIWVYWVKTSETPRISSESSELKLASFEEAEKLVSSGKAPKHYANDLQFLKESGLF